jgi:hypothetical protein
MAPTVPDLFVGWHAVEIGPAPPSPLYDRPPVVPNAKDLPAAHQRWRSQVEADQRRIAAAHARQPIWFPVPVFGGADVLPSYGGTAAMWGRLAATVALMATRAGFARIRLVNLTQSTVFDTIHRVAAKGGPISVRSDELSANGSTFDPFGNLAADELASLVVDVLRLSPDAHGLRSALHDKGQLIEIARRLSGNVHLGRLHDAVAVALDGQHAPAGASLSRAERDKLTDYHDDVVGRRPPVAARLGDLRLELEQLLCYGQQQNQRPSRTGSVGQQVRTLELAQGRATQDHQLGRELLSRAVARGFSTRVAGEDLLVVIGADLLSAEVLDHLTGSAGQPGKRLVLLFTKITDAAERVLGHGGSGCAVFLRLPNHQDARIAAEYLGREFTFVVNGFSIADGDTEQWTESYGKSSGINVGNSTTTTHSAGSAGTKLNFGRSFGSTVSTSFSSGTNQSSSTGGSRQRTHTTSLGRTHEYVLQPETFQHLPDDLMLVVDRRTVVLASCDPEIAGSSLAAAGPLARWQP